MVASRTGFAGDTDASSRRQKHLEKLALMCIYGGGFLQAEQGGITYCKMLPLDGESFPCPHSGGLVEIAGDPFVRYGCLLRKSFRRGET